MTEFAQRKSVTFAPEYSFESQSTFVLELQQLLNTREQQQVVVNETDYTPGALLPPRRFKRPKFTWDQFQQSFPAVETRRVRKEDCLSIKSSGLYEIMEDQEKATDKVEAFDLDQEPDFSGVIDRRSPSLEADATTYHVKIFLTETDDIILFESASHTVARDSEEAALVEQQNANYEAKRQGRKTATADAEAQNPEQVCKSRGVNTERIMKQEVASFVSNYDMYDTYNDLERHTKEIDLAEASSKLEITTYSREGMEDIDEMLDRSENFHLSSMILQRLLASNMYREKQMRFRNMYPTDPSNTEARFLYRLETLWTYKTVETMGKAVASASWCPSNGDIVAIAYGVYRFKEADYRSSGYVCVWNIKNPVNPERRYKFSVPVTAVAFSKKTPQLLAIGLFDGTVQITDIMDNSQVPVGVSERTELPVFEPIWDIEWIEAEDDKDEILTASQDGTIMKFTLNIGTYLMMYRQLRLNRVEGEVQGIPLEKREDFLEADSHPQALCLKIHPKRKDVYFVGTDEGCVHRCSIKIADHHRGATRVHSRGVFSIEYSPWSPKIFLTCGGDGYIRIWIEDIVEPIITLNVGFEPVQAARWSPVSSTIIASVTKNSVQLWNLSRQMLKPASITKFGDSTTSLTTIRFTNCGRSLLLGDSEGRTYVCALEDMPFPRHFQFNELRSTLLDSLVSKPELLNRIRRLGHLGY
ncbi:dynein axonemal intermediate chain 4 [Toxorhynchites rutilus septentrionalis]|uniref:dynein axonemal intermediate chain 4 n=1 Tax=Toxorhynchites rutilus septentrionalis TaxID=329112 RepID=UPI0024783D67|nr:dynein axonemal intermediate chain 4 [Toxorhynchites rutilus septentrionalis]